MFMKTSNLLVLSDDIYENKRFKHYFGGLPTVDGRRSAELPRREPALVFLAHVAYPSTRKWVLS
jgi:hypothetical protein